MMHKLPLVLAIRHFDHVSDLTSGRIAAEGIALTCVEPVDEAPWDIAEMPIADYVVRLAQGDDSLMAIPVFPVRRFCHSALYVRRHGPVARPADLVGRRVGLRDVSDSIAIYARGLLAHEFGLDLNLIEWLPAGTDGPSLSQLLSRREADAILSAEPPVDCEGDHPEVRHLFEDFPDVEAAAYRSGGVFPIHSVVVLRRPVFERFPWVAMNLLGAFEEAKRRSLARALDVTAPRFPVPWCFEYARRAQAQLGEDPIPYGVAANERTLGTFLSLAHEQGICHRKVELDELFPPNVKGLFKV